VTLPSHLRDATTVCDAGDTQTTATAVPLAERRRLIVLESLPELRIHRLRAAKDRLLRQL
jgi:hypothetical protein